jgi:methylmalonyl-CoA mutase N-terminal domain/subunit
MLLAFYLCVGEEQGVPRAKLRGTVQTDILKEYIAQKEWIFPPEPSMRLVIDMIEFCAQEMPLWHPISISGYHIREAGSNAAQELAFTLADGFAYVEAAVERGLDVDDFAPRLSFFFNAHLDFFEEIAKYRAARRIWAHELKERYGAKNPRSWLMRFHTQTAGVSLTAQQPEVNIIRTALEAMAAVLGGTQSLHTNSFDEALALPTENAVRLALRTQQVIAHETGVVNTIDPLGGSYYVEELTNRLEAEAYEYFDRIRKLGGVIPAIKENFFQREIAEASFRYQHEVEQKRRIIVGVNRYELDDEEPLEILKIDPALEGEQIGRVQALRDRRDSRVVESALARLKEDAAHEERNLMPPFVDASKAYVTMGEMCDALRGVWGVWRETPVFRLSFQFAGQTAAMQTARNVRLWAVASSAAKTRSSLPARYYMQRGGACLCRTLADSVSAHDCRDRPSGVVRHRRSRGHRGLSAHGDLGRHPHHDLPHEDARHRAIGRWPCAACRRPRDSGEGDSRGRQHDGREVRRGRHQQDCRLCADYARV